MSSSGAQGAAGVQDALSAFENERTIEQRESSRTIPRNGAGYWGSIGDRGLMIFR